MLFDVSSRFRVHDYMALPPFNAGSVVYECDNKLLYRVGRATVQSEMRLSPWKQPHCEACWAHMETHMIHQVNATLTGQPA